MKLIKINKPIKCDTVMCNNHSNFEIITNSYKGTMYLCESCFISLQKIIKRTLTKNEAKQ